jgi:protein-disulfide isomerase
MLRRASDLSVIVLAILFASFMWRANARLGALEAALAATPRRAASATPTTGSVSNEGVTIGSATAPVTLVQFTDYECPFCARFTQETMPTLYSEYVATGKVRLLVRDLPLPMHPNARMLAHAARCAAALTSRIHEFQQALYEGDGTGADPVVSRAAAAVGLDETGLRGCIDSQKYTAEIRKDSAAAARTGIRGTPAFLVGATGDSIRGRIISGAQPLATFVAALDSALASAGNGTKAGS